MLISSAPIDAGGSTKSIAPMLIAACGICGNFAVSSCANVIPPSALMALHPSAPSESEPDSTTAMARLP